jgi:hypothetical protein
MPVLKGAVQDATAFAKWFDSQGIDTTLLVDSEGSIRCSSTAKANRL